MPIRMRSKVMPLIFNRFDKGLMQGVSVKISREKERSSSRTSLKGIQNQFPAFCILMSRKHQSDFWLLQASPNDAPMGVSSFLSLCNCRYMEEHPYSRRKIYPR